MSAEQVVEIKKGMAQFLGEWNRKVQPTLQRDPRLPAQFILDVLKIVDSDIMRPVADVANGIIDANTSGGFLRTFLSGPFTELIRNDIGAAKKVQDRTEGAMKTFEFMRDRILLPLDKEAKQAIAAQGSRAMVRVVVTGTDRLDQVVAGAFQTGLNILVTLDEIAADAKENLFFRLGARYESAASAIKSLLSTLGAAIASGAGSLYSIFKTLIVVAKLALVGGAGYLGYRVYKQAKGGGMKQLAAGPTSNPRRRR